MAKKKKIEETISLMGEGDNPIRPRLHKLIISNFRSIGSTPVEVELDDIVVLVGPNNAGKSTVLRAYEVVMSHGSKEGRLSLDDFPRRQVDPSFLPTIELHTIVHSDAPGKKWIDRSNGEMLIRERWIWSSPNKDPDRQGFDIEKSDWDDGVPWGAPNVANSRRPLPHRIDAFETPDKQTTEITKLITALLKDKVEHIKTDGTQEKPDYEIILEKIKKLQIAVVTETGKEIEKIEKDISEYLSRVFPRHSIKFDARPDAELDACCQPFNKGNAQLLMGQEGGHFSSIEYQGSGARRTLLWATLKYLSEMNDGESSRPHVLLLDEPEICLHPSAIREARAVLYDLPKNKNWQVMITTHSPIFIDLSKDNTTIIRVYKDEASEVRSTTLYRPTTARLDNDDKKNLKLLNICDPYMHELFFGGTQIIVEGDTEYTAFSIIKELYPDEYGDVQIIRARGKGIIPSVAKVLHQFSKTFSILHDADTEKTKIGSANPAWGMNKSILEISQNHNSKVRLVACKTCFETALFGSEQKSDKPYNALLKIRNDAEIREKVKSLFDYLCERSDASLPENCVDWNSLEDLKA